MTSKHFCLKWNKFQSNILSAFESLQTTEDLADVTLTCEGINIRAHKFILSACSPYFRTIFKENPCSHPIVILKDVCHSDLMAIVNFMYQGEVTVSEEQLSSFLHTAMILQVSGLMTTNSGAFHKKQRQPTPPPVVPKKSRAINTESPPPQLECPLKKIKITSPKTAEDSIGNETKTKQSDRFEVRIKTEDETDMGNNNDIDISENVEVIVNEKETPPPPPASILEAALELRDKPSSILERSLTSSGKSPSFQPPAPPIEKINVLPDIMKPIFIPRKPPDETVEKRISKSSTVAASSSDSSNSPAATVTAHAYDYAPLIVSEFLQQRIKTEDHSDMLDVMSPEELNLQIRNVELQQPHHSSQCGNCPHCGKVYSNQSALKYHVRLVHSDLTNMYCCHLCPESFDYREGYKKHMAEVHLIRN